MKKEPESSLPPGTARIPNHVLIRELPGRFKGLATLCHAAAAEILESDFTNEVGKMRYREAYDITTGLLERLYEIRNDLNTVCPPPVEPSTPYRTEQV